MQYNTHLKTLSGATTKGFTSCRYPADVLGRPAAGVLLQPSVFVTSRLHFCNAFCVGSRLETTGEQKVTRDPAYRGKTPHNRSGPCVRCQQAPGGIQDVWFSSVKHRVLWQQWVPFPCAKMLQLSPETEMSLGYCSREEE